jgi:hypothetical protein
MVGASVEEASVDEHRHPSSREDEIGTTTDPRDRSRVHPEPESAPVKQ